MLHPYTNNRGSANLIGNTCLYNQALESNILDHPQAHTRFAYHFVAKTEADWMARYFFAGWRDPQWQSWYLSQWSVGWPIQKTLLQVQFFGDIGQNWPKLPWRVCRDTFVHVWSCSSQHQVAPCLLLIYCSTFRCHKGPMGLICDVDEKYWKLGLEQWVYSRHHEDLQTLCSMPRERMNWSRFRVNKTRAHSGLAARMTSHCVAIGMCFVSSLLP